MRIYGQIGKLKADKVEEYKHLHLNPWSKVLEVIKKCHISNYSIFLHGRLVFAYFEYSGENFADDMETMARDEATQIWWAHTKPCFEKFAISSHAEFYCDMEVIFYMD